MLDQLSGIILKVRDTCIKSLSSRFSFNKVWGLKEEKKLGNKMSQEVDSQNRGEMAGQGAKYLCVYQHTAT